MKTDKIATAFVLLGIPSYFFLSAGTSTSVALELVIRISAFFGASMLYSYLKGIGKVAGVFYMLATVVGLFVWLLGFMKYFYFNLPVAELINVKEGSKQIESLLFVAGQLCFLFYNPLSKLRFGWIVLLLFNPLLLKYLSQYSDIAGILFAWRGVPVLIVSVLFVVLVYPAQSKERRYGIAFLCMFIGMVHSLNILFGNGVRIIVIAILGAVLWLTGVGVLRHSGDEKKGSGAFIAYGILMLLSLGIHLLFASVLFLVPGIVGDVLAFLLQLPAYIIACIGFTRFAKTGVFHIRECGMRTMAAVMIIGSLLAVIFLVPMAGKMITSWGLVLVLIPLTIQSWGNAFQAAGQRKTEIQVKTEVKPVLVMESSYKRLTAEEKREQQLRDMSIEELKDVIRQTRRFSPDMREAAESELHRRDRN